MKKLSTYLLVMFMGMFWVFRIIVAVLYNLNIEFIIVPHDFIFEVVLLFITLITIILIIKRSIFGAIIYFIAYELYFGTIMLNMISKLGDVMTLNISIEFIVTLIGIVLPLSVLIDLLLDKNRKNNPKNKKTDWFYKNKDFDRKFDERADRNEYKF